MKFLDTLVPFILIGCLFTLCVIGILPKPATIHQDVSTLEDSERRNLEVKYKDSIKTILDGMYISNNPNVVEINLLKKALHNNPYGKYRFVYKITSLYKDSTCVDYGTKDKIIMFKAKHYRVLKEFKKFDDCKYSVAQRDIDEINSVKVK